MLHKVKRIAEAKCLDCAWFIFTDYPFPPGKDHHDSTGHTVQVEQTDIYRYQSD